MLYKGREIPTKTKIIIAVVGANWNKILCSEDVNEMYNTFY